MGVPRMRVPGMRSSSGSRTGELIRSRKEPCWGHGPVGGGSTVPGCNGTAKRAVLAPRPEPLLDTLELAQRNGPGLAPGPRTTPGYALRRKYPNCS
eukprot:329006-Rhodomonas_salina.1